MLLRIRFRRLCEDAGVSGHGADALLDELAAAYAEPHRYYHNLAHVESMLATLDAVTPAAMEASARQALEFAAYYHDVVYDPSRGDNEERSADMMDAALRPAGVAMPLRAEIRRLILLTKGHTPDSGDLAGATLVDADMAVLGHPDGERYLAYARAVAAEYAVYPAEQYLAGHRKFLAGVLDRPRVFAGDLLHESLDKLMRRNIRAELELLIGKEAVDAMRAEARPLTLSDNLLG